jgi:hypothetical protein
MPPEMECPFCTNRVPDWHFEWHLREDQAGIVAGHKALECPVCHAGVAFDGFVVSKAPSDRVVVGRDIRQAARWARNQNVSLRDYLGTAEGHSFAGFWSDADVEKADQETAP